MFNEIANVGREPESSGEAGTSGSLSISRKTAPSVTSLSNFVCSDVDRLDRVISSTHELLRTTSNALELALSFFGEKLAGQRQIAEDHHSHQAASEEQELDDVHASPSPILIATPTSVRGRAVPGCGRRN